MDERAADEARNELAGETARSTARVLCVVDAGRCIADSADELGRQARQRLPATSGLSEQGVQLALERYLETHPAKRDIEGLLRSATRARRCLVVLAANVCTAALRAICCATATSPMVFVRPSSRDPVVAELLVQALQSDESFTDAGGSIELCEQLQPVAGDEVHLYGSDRTITELQSTLPTGVRVRAHGTGIGVAVVDEDVELGQGAAALTEDVIIFDQRGCLSPRFVLVQGGPSRAERCAALLHRALATRGQQVPRGPLRTEDRSELTRYRSTMEAVGRYRHGASHAVALDPDPKALALPPALRCIHVVPCDHQQAQVLLEPWTRFVVALGAGLGQRPGPLGAHIRELVPAARISALGMMQLPPLDGPVDGRG